MSDKFFVARERDVTLTGGVVMTAHQILMCVVCVYFSLCLTSSAQATEFQLFPQGLRINNVGTINLYDRFDVRDFRRRIFQVEGASAEFNDALNSGEPYDNISLTIGGAAAIFFGDIGTRKIYSIKIFAGTDQFGNSVGDPIGSIGKAADILCSQYYRDAPSCINVATPMLDYERDDSKCEGHQVALNECQRIASITLYSPESPGKPSDWLSDFIAVSAYLPEFDRFPADSTYSKKPKVPDFNGRDRPYREWRTRIRWGLAQQPTSNFAGRFNLVDLTITGGVQIAIIESASGRVRWLGVIKGPWPGRDYAFRKTSRLLVSQSSNGDRCWIDNYLWTGSDFQIIGDAIEQPIDSEGSCKFPLPDSAFENR